MIYFISDIHGDKNIDALNDYVKNAKEDDLLIILGDIERYAAALSSGGKLLLSGFLGEDVEAIREAATALGFECTGIEAEEEWRALSFTKR